MRSQKIIPQIYWASLGYFSDEMIKIQFGDIFPCKWKLFFAMLGSYNNFEGEKVLQKIWYEILDVIWSPWRNCPKYLFYTSASYCDVPVNIYLL